MRKQKPETIQELIRRGMAIEAAEAQDAGALGYMARAMTLASLPHKRVAGNEFVRRNGAFTLSIVAPTQIGLPFGTIPRLLLAWLTTEAVRTRNRELMLGDSLSEFMWQLRMVPTGGRWGTIGRLRAQTTRLFASSITAIYQDDDKTALLGYRVADKALMWWNATKDPAQRSLFESVVTLTEPFYREIIEKPVPIDMRALTALKKSPLALDIYFWLTHRMSYLKAPKVIPWELLQMQFGAGYPMTPRGLRAFRENFLAQLRKVLVVYSAARVTEATDAADGLRLAPSRTHIAPRAGY